MAMMKAVGVFFVLLMVLSVNTALASHFTWRSATTVATPENALRALISQEHDRVCVGSLAGDARLTWMARYRSADMLNNDYFAHVNPWTKRSVFPLMSKAGIQFITGSEILVWNTYPDDLTASVAYRQFMGSTGHRAAIQACRYERFGVGAYKVGDKKMFTVVFIDI